MFSAFAGALSAPRVSIADPNSGLVAAWDFENVVDNRVPDLSGHGNDGIAREASWYKGRFGTALWVKEGKGLIEVSDSPSLRRKDALTLEAWVCPFALSHAQKIVDRPGASDFEGYWLDVVDDGVFNLCIGGGSQQNWKRIGSRKPANVEDWYHVVGTFDHGTLRLYVNGALQREEKGPLEVLSRAGEKLYIGAHRGPGSYPWNGLIDEVRIYDRALTDAEVSDRYKEGSNRHGATLVTQEVKAWPLRTVLRAGEGSEIPLVLSNRTDREQQGGCNWEVVDSEGKALAHGVTQQVTVSPGSEGRATLSVPPLSPGELILHTWWGSDTPYKSNHRILMLAKRHPGPRMQEVKLNLRLVDDIDCTREYGPDRYTSLPGTRIVGSPLGKYREAGPASRDRFAYRIKIGTVGRPHLLVFDYPDDRKRTFGILDGTTMDLSGGVITGGVHPITGTFQSQQILFWPRDTNRAVVFMTWAEGLPAAVRSIKVYEVEGPLPVQAITDAGEGEKRFVGFQFEDPSVEVGFGAFRIPEATISDSVTYGAYEHMAQYLAYTGQNLYKYPISWYSGPHYRSRFFHSYRQGAGVDPDWVQAMLLMFQDYGISYLPSMMLLRLPTLMDNMVYDENAVRAGKPTFNMCLADGGVRGTSNDWTAWGDPPDAAKHNPGPIFDPIHPTVRGEIRKLFQEILDRYGDYPNFKGISLNMWVGAIVWFYSLQNGYGDYDLTRFENETGIRVPVDNRDPDQFKKRYEWLRMNAKEQWILWRCKQVHAFLVELRDMMVKKRKDLRLQLSCWPWYVRNGGRLEPTPADQLGALPSSYALHREGGLDWKMFLEEPNIDLELQFTPQHQRLFEGPTPVPATMYFRDLDFIDFETLSSFHHPPDNACFLYNGYFETFTVDRPLPDWWFGKEWLNHPGLLLADKFFMEHYAQAAAALDARFITRGGVEMATIGHDANVRGFARAMRALPAGGFRDVPANADTVVVRHLRGRKRYYLCLINREFEPTRVTLHFAATPTGLTDLTTGKALSVTGKAAALEMSPYGVMALGLEARGPGVLNVEIEVPAAVRRWVDDRFVEARKAMESLLPDSPGIARISEAMVTVERERARSHYFAAHHLLESYAIQNALSHPRREKQ